MVEDVSAEDWTRVFNVNVRGYALMAKHVVPYMKQQKSGSIIQFGSIRGCIAQPAFVPYNTTKGAVIQMTRNLALDLGSYNIRCNTVSPGAISKFFFTLTVDTLMLVDPFRYFFSDTACT